MALTTLPSGFTVRPLPLPNGFDPLTATEQDLISHGLPRRPPDPALLSAWEDMVQGLARSTFIEPEISPTDPQHSPRPRSGAILGQQWSGGIVFLPQNSPAGAKFYVVTGRWTVPYCAPGAGAAIQFYRSSWVGIDGWNSPDILQAGVTCIAARASPQSTYPWWEWYPAGENRITNFPVKPSDVVSCTISANSATVANVNFSNISTSHYTAFRVTAGPNTRLAGECAEWIVERPRHGGGITQLANYGSLAFQVAWGGTNLGGSDAIRDPSQGQAMNMRGDDGRVVSTGNVSSRQVDCKFV